MYERLYDLSDQELHRRSERLRAERQELLERLGNIVGEQELVTREIQQRRDLEFLRESFLPIRPEPDA